MGLIVYLATEFWPVIVTGGALLLGWAGLRAKAASDREKGRSEAKQQQELANARAAADRVSSDEIVRRSGAGAAREQLRRDWHK